MVLRIYVFIWLAVLAFFSYEYAALNLGHWPSLMRFIAFKRHLTLSTDPGKTLSLYLGWIGLSLMIAMNAYSIRKRAQFLNGAGKLSAWLNFHVFCGLLGPTLILFHCNFKVRGLVAISFWSMVVSFTSGVIGRYFYLQIALKKMDLQKMGEKWRNRLIRFLKQREIAWNDDEYNPILQNALAIAGMPNSEGPGHPFKEMSRALFGDLRLRFVALEIPEEWPPQTEFAVKEYAIHVRRAATLDSFRRLMGYWHAFHFPFAVFMYITAAIHVTSSLVFL